MKAPTAPRSEVARACVAPLGEVYLPVSCPAHSAAVPLELSFLAIHLKLNPSDIGKAEKGDLPWREIRDTVLKSPRSQDYVAHMVTLRMNKLASWLTAPEVKGLYSTLSQAVHSRIESWDMLTGGVGHGPAYSYTKFGFWHRHFIKVHRLCFLTLLLHFPDIVKYFQGPLIDGITMADNWLGAVLPSQRRYLIRVS